MSPLRKGAKDMWSLYMLMFGCNATSNPNMWYLRGHVPPSGPKPWVPPSLLQDFHWSGVQVGAQTGWSHSTLSHVLYILHNACMPKGVSYHGPRASTCRAIYCDSK